MFSGAAGAWSARFWEHFSKNYAKEVSTTVVTITVGAALDLTGFLLKKYPDMNWGDHNLSD
jgi:hypothetical protein